MLWYHRLAVMSFKYKLEFDLSLWNIHDNIRFIESHNRVCPDKPLPFEHNLLLREELRFHLNCWSGGGEEKKAITKTE